MTSRNLSRAVSAALLACTAGCLPVPVTRTLSPHVEGTYQREDGTPIVGARVLISTADDDHACARPTAAAVTDSAGRFTFTAIKHRESVVLLIPYDRLFCFQICGGETGAPLPGYRTCGLQSAPPSQVVWCVAARETGSPDTPRLACRGRAARPADLTTRS